MKYLSIIILIILTSCSDKSPINLQEINIKLKNNETKKLEKFRKKALEKGYITRKEKQYLKANVNNSSANIKLKGDWTDHLKTDKWSFRIKLKDTSILGCSIFSIQHPKTRDFLNEYFLHNWCEKEDILTTKYDFLNVIFNEEDKGVFAYEEHFNWSLLERYNRPKAPIFKFFEDDLFDHYKWKWQYEEKFFPPVIEAAPIEAFQFNEIKNDNQLIQLWEEGRALIFDMQWGLKEAKDLFDFENAAKYYAIISITKSYHALTWHNQRFYFNPNTKKLEHILYDGSNEDAKAWVWKPVYGYYGEHSKLSKHNIECHHTLLFQDAEFIKLYIQYLEKFSDPKYIRNLIEKETPGLEKYRKAILADSERWMLSEEITKEDLLDTSLLLLNAKKIRSYLPEYKTLTQTDAYYERARSFKFKDDFEAYEKEYPSILVKAYIKGDSLQVINFYSKEIKHSSMYLEAYKRNTFPKIYTFPLGDTKKFKFEVNGKTFKIEPVPYALPSYSIPEEINHL